MSWERRRIGSSLAAAAAVFVMVAVWHHARHTGPGGDARVYLAVAQQFATGHGPLMPDGTLMTMRAPLWPMLLGSFMAVFGDPAGADLARMAVAGAVGSVIAGLGRWWYCWTTGVLAVVLACSAPPLLDVLSDWYADGLALALALGGVLLLDAAARRPTVRLGIGAGLVLAVAVLVKESAGFVAAGPVIAALACTDRDGWGWVRPVGAAGFASSAVVTPWLVMHLAVEGRFFLTDLAGAAALGALGGWLVIVGGFALVVWTPGRLRARARGLARRWSSPRAAGLAALTVTLVWTGAITIGLRGGLGFEAQDLAYTPGEIARRFLLPAFGVSVIAVAGVAVLLAGSARRRRSELAHLGALVGYLPIMVLWPLNGSIFVARNALIGVVLVHLAGARAVVLIVTRAARAVRTLAPIRVRIGAVIAASALLASCAWAGLDGVRMEPATRDAPTADLEALSAWLRARVPSGTPIMGSYLDWTWVERATDAAYPVHLTPWTHLEVTRSRPFFRPIRVVPVIGDPQPYQPDSYGDDWLAITRSPTKGYLAGLSQTALLSALRATRARYLLVTGSSVYSTLGIVPVLERIGGLRLARRSGRIVVFAVEPDHLVPVVNPPTWTDLLTRRWIEHELARTRGVASRGAATDRDRYPPRFEDAGR